MPAGQRERRADGDEDETDLAARHHAESNRESVHVATLDAERARELARDGGRRQKQREPDGLGASERAQVNPQTHQHEEDGHEQRADGREQLRQAAPAAPRERLQVNLVEHKPRGERADDGCEPRERRRPREQKAEGYGDRDEHAAPLEPARAAQQLRHDVAPRQKRAQEKRDRLQRYKSEVGERERLTRGGGAYRARDDGQNQKRHHVVNHRRAEYDARLARL